MSKTTQPAAALQAQSPDPDDVWRVDTEGETPVSYLVDPIDDEGNVSVTPRHYIEFKAHDNAEPIILSSVEALRLARVLEAAATKLERGEGFVR